MLRSDTYNLFDFGLIAIDPDTFKPIVADSIRQSPYGAFHGNRIRLPADPKAHPSRKAFRKVRVLR